MEIVMVVEGKRDKAKLERLLTENVLILCTFGTPGTEKLHLLRSQADSLPVYIFTDNDTAGKRIRFLLNEVFVDAENIYTRREYAGVEGTPDEYIIQQLEKADLDEYIVYPVT
jgi:toprim domain protein